MKGQALVLRMPWPTPRSSTGLATSFTAVEIWPRLDSSGIEHDGVIPSITCKAQFLVGSLREATQTACEACPGDDPSQ